MGDVGTGITDVPVHLAHNTNVLITVEQRVLILTVHAIAASTAVRRLVRLKTGIGQDNNEPLGVLVGGRDRRALLSNQLREGRRRKRLRSCEHVSMKIAREYQKYVCLTRPLHSSSTLGRGHGGKSE